MGQQFFINPLCLGIVYTTHIVSFPICGKLEKRIISGFKKTLTSSPPEMVNVPFSNVSMLVPYVLVQSGRSLAVRSVGSLISLSGI